MMNFKVLQMTEYIDAHAYALATPTLTHHIIHSNLYKILALIFDKKKCRVFSAPFDVTLKNESSGSLNVLQPDLLVSCDYGVIEYWIIDPRDKRVIVYLFKERQPEGISVFTAKDIVASYTFPEIHIKAVDIFSDI